MELVRQGHSEAAAVRKVGLPKHATRQWKHGNVFNYRERLDAARAEAMRRLSSRSRDAFPEEEKQPWAKAFLEEFRRSGEQVKACRFAGITLKQLRDTTNPENKDYIWWFGEAFAELLAEQRQEILDTMIAKKDSASLLQFIAKNEEIVLGKKATETTADEVSDASILEALASIAERVNATPGVPSVKP